MLQCQHATKAADSITEATLDITQAPDQSEATITNINATFSDATEARRDVTEASLKVSDPWLMELRIGESQGVITITEPKVDLVNSGYLNRLMFALITQLRKSVGDCHRLFSLISGYARSC